MFVNSLVSSGNIEARYDSLTKESALYAPSSAEGTRYVYRCIQGVLEVASFISDLREEELELHKNVYVANFI